MIKLEPLKKAAESGFCNPEIINPIFLVNTVAVDKDVFLGLIRELEQARIGHDRYEKVRKLGPHQFADLHERNIAGHGKFDDLVDALPSHKGKI